MHPTREIRVRCRISRSSFSGERVFRVAKSDGDEHIGVAPVHYFLTQNNEPLGEHVPPNKGDQVPGWIQALLIENGDDEANVVFPGGEMARVNLREVASQSTESISYLPIGS